MRDIKFRGYDLEHKVWRYGWLTQLVEGARRFMAIVCDDSEGDLTRYYIHSDKTVGQYTGLKDKNGVEIYEGDILTGMRHKPIGARAEVVFDSRLLTFLTINDLGEVYYIAQEGEDIEVIGNTYENPELLEVEK